MEDISVLQRPVKTTDRKVRTNLNRPVMSPETQRKSNTTERLASEVDENFISYLNSHGLASEDNLLVLSANKHYYYDYDELKEVTTLINLKKLNLVKHLDDFLHSIRDGLSPKTNFIGCFSDGAASGVSKTSRWFKRFLNFLDAKTDYEIDKSDFSKLLESCGFKVIDMKEINGLTYFLTQN
jgi:hypothetical protein